MSNIPKKLKDYVKDLKNLKHIGRNKHLAKFGDTITNTAYSIAKSYIIGYLDARKVNKTILSFALKQADMKIYAKPRSDAHALADTVEAFIGYMYCAEYWSIEDIALKISLHLQDFDLNDYVLEKEGAILAFKYLLLEIKENLLQKYPE